MNGRLQFAKPTNKVLSKLRVDTKGLFDILGLESFTLPGFTDQAPTRRDEDAGLAQFSRVDNIVAIINT